MDFSVQCRPYPSQLPSGILSKDAPGGFTVKLCLQVPGQRRPRNISQKRSIVIAFASGNGSWSERFFWPNLAQSLRRGTERFLFKFAKLTTSVTGIDLGENSAMIGFGRRVQEAAKRSEFELERFRSELVPQFVAWNALKHWKDFKNWGPKRTGAFIFYIFVVAISCQRVYSVAIQAPRIYRQKIELTEAYMEALIPEPSPSNVRKLKKGMWRKTMPKGLKMKKFIERPDGSFVHDSDYVGEDAWVDDPEPQEKIKQAIGGDQRFSTKEKRVLSQNLGISDDSESLGTWRERIHRWKQIMQTEKLAEQLNPLNAKYVVEFDMNEVESSLRKHVEKITDTQGTRGLWISKRWWRYRPKLPYTYFLQKLDCSEVAAVVFTEDLKRLYATMKEGFPLEYIVDIPLDPYLFEMISSSDVEVDLLQKRQTHYLLRVVLALLPGIIILWLIRESLMLLYITTKRFLYKKYSQLIDMAYEENFVLPLRDVDETKSMYKEVVLGGDAWDLLDELMIYMRNPMKFYERDVKFVRGVLLSGPPGTGKTLFARTLSKESGMPFVFASGAEFIDSEKSGVARVNRMFSTARRNAPSFVFVDEIDAIAGRHARKDPRRRAIFDALIAQLDGEKEKTGVDRCSLRQAVIFICATNRPEELDPQFVRLGRIDRRLYIGLPNAKQRVQIFHLHSAGRLLSEDVDFGKLVFRTVGYSGADVRNLVNEAGIISVRKGNSKIFQQDIVDALDKQLLEGMGVLLTEEERQKCQESISFEKKRLLAVHEAGHIVLAHLFPRFDWHAFSQLLPGGKETAISVFYPREDIVDQGYTTFNYLKMHMVVAHGGRCAERVVFGDDVTDGGKDDLEKITKIAREMAISPNNARLGLTALTKRIGPLDPPDRSDSEIIKFRWDDPDIIPTDMTVELSELFTRELTRYIEETEELAMNGLKNNRHILDLIAMELQNKSSVTGLAVEEMMKGVSHFKFEDFAKPYQINPDEEEPLPRNDELRYQPLDIYPAPLHRC